MILVVGGHTRNIGKTSAVEAILRQTPEANWTAVKVTQHGHGICANSGEPCGCETVPECPVALDEQRVLDSTDSGRFLAAGASRAYWLRTAQGELARAMPMIRQLAASSVNIVFESNSLLQFLKPDLYIAVVDFRAADRKASFQRYADRADAFVVTGGTGTAAWMTGKPVLTGLNEELGALVRKKLGILR